MSQSILTPEGAALPPAEPGRQRGRDFAEWVHIAANIAVILSAMVVVPMYLIERRDTNELERQQLAAQMFQRKYDDRVMVAYIKVSDAFDSSNSLFPIFSGAQDEAKKVLAEKIMAETGIQNIKIVIDYYNDLLVCMDEGLCDRRLTVGLVGQDIHNFYCKARYVGLPQLRERYAYAEYGDRLGRFAGSCDRVGVS